MLIYCPPQAKFFDISRFCNEFSFKFWRFFDKIWKLSEFFSETTWKNFHQMEIFEKISISNGKKTLVRHENTRCGRPIERMSAGAPAGFSIHSYDPCRGIFLWLNVASHDTTSSLSAGRWLRTRPASLAMSFCEHCKRANVATTLAPMSPPHWRYHSSYARVLLSLERGVLMAGSPSCSAPRTLCSALRTLWRSSGTSALGLSTRNVNLPILRAA